MCGMHMELVNAPVDTSAPPTLIPKEHWRCLCGHVQAIYTAKDEA